MKNIMNLGNKEPRRNMNENKGCGAGEVRTDLGVAIQ